MKRLSEISADPVGSTPAEPYAMMRNQVARFRPIIQEPGIMLD